MVNSYLVELDAVLCDSDLERLSVDVELLLQQDLEVALVILEVVDRLLDGLLEGVPEVVDGDLDGALGGDEDANVVGDLESALFPEFLNPVDHFSDAALHLERLVLPGVQDHAELLVAIDHL